MGGVPEVFGSGAVEQSNGGDDGQRLRAAQRRDVRHPLLNQDHALTSAREGRTDLSPRSGRQHTAWGASPRFTITPRLLSPRSGRQHKAWGASPRFTITPTLLSPRSGRQHKAWGAKPQVHDPPQHY